MRYQEKKKNKQSRPIPYTLHSLHRSLNSPYRQTDNTSPSNIIGKKKRKRLTSQWAQPSKSTGQAKRNGEKSRRDEPRDSLASTDVGFNFYSRVISGTVQITMYGGRFDSVCSIRQVSVLWISPLRRCIYSLVVELARAGVTLASVRG